MEGLLRCGIGLRQPHYAKVIETLPSLDLLEVHSENYFHDGGAALHVLEQVRAHYPLSLHGVGLALASADMDDTAHVDRLAALVRRVEPVLVSEHLCWGRVDGRHFNDLLPFPYTCEALLRVAARVSALQDRLKRRLLIENLSAYVRFSDSEMSEAECLSELVRITGCGLLLDVNNLYVNACNFGDDPGRILDALPLHAVGEIHLAGHDISEFGRIDTHGQAVCDEVWDLYREVRRRGVRAQALVEWDTDLPPLQVLIDEARRADAIDEQFSGDVRAA